MPARRYARTPLSAGAWAVLRAVRASGGSEVPDALLRLVGGSWRALLGIVGQLETRGLVTLKPGIVILTRDGFHALGTHG